MNGSTENNKHPGGGFAAEAASWPEGDSTPPAAGAASASSGREKTSVALPVRVGTTLPNINRRMHLPSYSSGWNDCMDFIIRANPEVVFYTLPDTFDPKYWG